MLGEKVELLVYLYTCIQYYKWINKLLSRYPFVNLDEEIFGLEVNIKTARPDK